MVASVNYDLIASGYDRRYIEHQYSGIDATLTGFVRPGHAVLEVGCGTGYWLTRLQALGCDAIGLDPSREMLRRAQGRSLSSLLVQGRGEAVPFQAGSFDRVVVINALHHLEEPVAFPSEAVRVIRPGGRVVVMGLDPSAGLDNWFIYKYFPRTLQLDMVRYPSTAQITRWLQDAGFGECSSCVGHHIRVSESASAYLSRGALAKGSTSQLSLLETGEYEEGIDRIRRAIEQAADRNEDLALSADLRIYATFGTVRARPTSLRLQV